MLFAHFPETPAKRLETPVDPAGMSKSDLYIPPRPPLRRGPPGDPREDAGITRSSRGNAHKSLSPNTPAVSSAETYKLLHEQERELVVWRDAMRRAQSVLDPFEAAFLEAHEHCALVVRTCGLGVGNPNVKRAYDRRLVAGHAAHPHRLVLREAQRMVKVITDHIRELNKELSS